MNGDRWNAAFSLPAAVLRAARGDLAAAFETVVAFNPTLARRLKGARRLGRFLSAPLPRFAVTTNWPSGVVPVGNAAAALEPIGGEGMGLALRSAEMAIAEIVRRSDANRAASLTLDADYRRLWQLRRLTCRTAARIVANPTLATAITPLLFHNRRLTIAAMRWAGKKGATVTQS